MNELSSSQEVDVVNELRNGHNIERRPLFIQELKEYYKGSLSIFMPIDYIVRIIIHIDGEIEWIFS